ncbi:MAG: DNA repair protein RecO [Labilithrix sp.]|nr:DNA repair protein RecO [Labilithrix sp.]MCW5813775.1 DNA repair protein RecO [Labilithrix sp.]
MIRRIDSPALLVRSVPYGESDVIATFFTRDAGVLGAIVRGARRSQKRFGGALEPIHELFIGLDDKGKELCFLKEARIQRARTGITASLDAMDAAGEALRWTRHLCPPRTPEPAAWRSLEVLFDVLDAGADPRSPLAVFGLRLLTDMGYALELDQCVRCGRPCPPGRSAFLDGARGGLVCTGCGGARRTVKPDLRALAARAQRGEAVDLRRDEADELIEIAREAMAAHAGVDAV